MASSALIERALGGGFSHYPGYAPGVTKHDDVANHRYGARGKTVLTDSGTVRIEVPRDRGGSRK